MRVKCHSNILANIFPHLTNQCREEDKHIHYQQAPAVLFYSLIFALYNT